MRPRAHKTPFTLSHKRAAGAQKALIRSYVEELNKENKATVLRWLRQEEVAAPCDTTDYKLERWLTNVNRMPSLVRPDWASDHAPCKAAENAEVHQAVQRAYIA